MFVIRLIGKIAALPLIVLMAIAGFLFNLATDLSGYVIGPALLLILGFDIYFLCLAPVASPSCLARPWSSLHWKERETV